MAYTTLQLIADAYYLGGIVSRDFETPTGSQVADALTNLNDLFSEKTVDQGMIPYYQQLNLNAVIGQQKYFIEDLIDIDTFVFFINSVRYSTQKVARRAYFGSPRADNIESLPFSWHLERELGGASIYLYFFPDVAYPLEIWGQFRLSSVTINQDLELTLDRFYISFMKYELADRMCQYFNFTTPPFVSKKLQILYEHIEDKSTPMDLQQQKFSTMTVQGPFSYAQCNIGKGWYPSQLFVIEYGIVSILM